MRLQRADRQRGLGTGSPRRPTELPLVTCGDEASTIARFANSDEDETYFARDVIQHLLSEVDPARV